MLKEAKKRLEKFKTQLTLNQEDEILMYYTLLKINHLYKAHIILKTEKKITLLKSLDKYKLEPYKVSEQVMKSENVEDLTSENEKVQKRLIYNNR